MIVRIVKLTLKKETIADFEHIFKETKDRIRSTEGCSLLELYQDVTNPTVFFTYSHWESDQYLENYRESEFFKTVWGKTKLLFDQKPEAWSVQKIHTLN